jgi:hypothetical protein
MPHTISSRLLSSHTGDAAADHNTALWVCDGRYSIVAISGVACQVSHRNGIPDVEREVDLVADYELRPVAVTILIGDVVDYVPGFAGTPSYLRSCLR